MTPLSATSLPASLVEAESPLDRVASWVHRRRRMLFGLAILLHIVSFSGVWRPGPDSSLFRAAARNLAERGEFAANALQTLEMNAGFPYLLSWLHAAMGERAWPALLLIHLCAMGAAAMAFLLIRRVVDAKIATLVALLLLVNVTFVRHSIEILADIPFMFACMTFLYGYERCVAGVAAHRAAPALRAQTRAGLGGGLGSRVGSGVGVGIGVGVVLMAAGVLGMASLRVVFLLPVAAIAAELAWRALATRSRAVIGVSLLLIVTMAAMIALVRVLDPRLGEGATLLSKERQILDLFHRAPEVLKRSWDFCFMHLFAKVTPTAMFGNRVGVVPIDLLISGAVLISGLMLARRRVAWGVLVGLCFLQWLLFFPDQRYFLPILPLLIVGWCDLTNWVARRMAARFSSAWGVRVAAGMIGLMLIANTARSLGFAIEQRRGGLLEHHENGRYDQLPELAAWAQANLSPDAVILADPLLSGPLHYWSRLRTVTPELYERFQGSLDDAAIVVLLPPDASMRNWMAAMRLGVGPEIVSITSPTTGRTVGLARLSSARVAPASAPSH